jgi:hypothetical protein
MHLVSVRCSVRRGVLSYWLLCRCHLSFGALIDSSVVLRAWCDVWRDSFVAPNEEARRSARIVASVSHRTVPELHTKLHSHNQAPHCLPSHVAFYSAD